MSSNIQRRDLVGYLSMNFFAEKQGVAEIVTDYLDEEHKNTIFFEKPSVIYVDEDYSTKPPPYETIDRLRQSLQENGPLVTVGKMGPNAYTGACFKLQERVCDKEIYGWQPNTFKEYAPQITAILVGARTMKSRSYVYFICAMDITKDSSSLIRGYITSMTDTKIYVMSYENYFKRSLVDLHPICPHAQWLFSVPVNSILDRGEVEQRCKQVGQQIFDHYKKAGKNSQAGENAVIRICQAAKFLTADGRIRYSHIESAWEGIGDNWWRWQS